MARDISELGADVIDDTPVDPKRRMSAKKRNYIIGLSITGVLLAGAVVATVVLCNTALTDYSNVRNVMYYITPNSTLKEGEKPGAVLYKLDSQYKYASTFRIPSQVKGYPVVGVADSAFSGHTEIKRIVMPNSLRFVGTKAFYNCSNLSKFSWSKSLTDVGVDAFTNTKFYENLLKDPSNMYKIPSGLLVYVGEDYFDNNTALVSDNLSETEIANIKDKYSAVNVAKFSDFKITGICSGAFRNNHKLVYVDFSQSLDIDTVFDYTFENCSNLKGVDFTHSNVSEVAQYAFANSKKLKDVKLSDTVTKIGNYAFSNVGFENDIPDISKVISFGEGIFAGCTKLQTLNYNANFVPAYTFADCEKLDFIEWGVDNSNIDNIESIGIGAFSNTGFTTFTVPKSLSVINDYTFKGSKKLTTVRLYGNPSNAVKAELDPDDYEYDDKGEIIPPTYIDDDGITQDGFLLGVNTLYAGAFNGCSELNTISLYGDDGSDITGKANVGEFHFPKSLTKTDAKHAIEGKNNYMFAYTKVNKAVITANLRNIGSYSYYGASSLTEVEFENPSVSRLTTINDSAFENCSNLPSITIPSSVTSINSSVFKGCVNLVTVDIGNTKIKTIAGELFYNCQKLTHVDIPEGVTIIKKEAFYKNYALDYIVVPSTITALDNGCVKDPRQNESDEPLPIFMSMTYEQATENISRYKESYFGDECKIYYFLEGEKEPGRNYWKVGTGGEPEIIPND